METRIVVLTFESVDEIRQYFCMVPIVFQYFTKKKGKNKGQKALENKRASIIEAESIPFYLGILSPLRRWLVCSRIACLTYISHSGDIGHINF